MVVQILKGRIANIGDLKSGTTKGRDWKLVNFSIAHNPTWRNPDTDEWVNGDTVFENCVAYNRLAEEIVNRLQKGAPVVAVGNRQSKAPFTTRNGVEVPVSYEYVVSELGLDISLLRGEVIYAEKNTNYRNGDGNSSAPRATSNTSNDEGTLKSRPQPAHNEIDDMDEPPF